MRFGDDVGEEGGDCGGCRLEVVGGGVEEGARGEDHAPGAEVVVVGYSAALWKEWRKGRRGGAVGDGVVFIGMKTGGEEEEWIMSGFQEVDGI